MATRWGCRCRAEDTGRIAIGKGIGDVVVHPAETRAAIPRLGITVDAYWIDGTNAMYRTVQHKTGVYGSGSSSSSKSKSPRTQYEYVPAVSRHRRGEKGTTAGEKGKTGQ